MTMTSAREPLLGASKRGTVSNHEEQEEDDESTVQVIEDQVGKALDKLIEWGEIPKWMKDNHYIQSGYRRSSGKIRDSIASLGYLHNESVNIYTHLIPGLLAFGLFIWGDIELVNYIKHHQGDDDKLLDFLLKSYPTTTWKDYTVISIFLAGCAGCLIMSSIYHCLNHHSELLSFKSQKLDYLGIILLIVGSFIPTIYYGLYLYPSLIIFYWSLSILFGLACIYATFNPLFNTPDFRPYRAGIFVLFGLSGILPILTGFYKMGIHQSLDRCNFNNLILMALMYIIGAIIYSARFPECIWPGKFDIWASSHQIFHVFVVLGAFFQLRCLVNAYNYCHTHPPN